jgi:DNA-nicking Smr family endonuclease
MAKVTHKKNKTNRGYSSAHQDLFAEDKNLNFDSEDNDGQKKPVNLASPFAVLADLRADLLYNQNKEKLALQKAEAKTKKDFKATKAKLLAQSSSSAFKDEVNRVQNEDIATINEKAEENLFLQAMEGVVPLADTVKRREQEPLSTECWKAPEYPDEDLLVMRDLTDLISGKSEFDFAFTDELCEAQIKGLPPALMDNLRKGSFPIQDHLDLHGMNLPQAERAINEFVTRSVYLGRTCILLIHGRGQGSPDGISIIKRNLESLLLRGSSKKYILAFTTARPIDGGSGASYILLRG